MSNTQKQQYRNQEDLVSIEGIEVEAGSLWELKPDNILVLVDEDQYASYVLDSELFLKI